MAAYAIADTLNRGFKAHFQTQRQRLPLLTATTSPGKIRSKPTTATTSPKLLAATTIPATKPKLFHPVTATAVDSLMWHGAASLAWPYVVINRTVWATHNLLARHRSFSPALQHALPTLAGLAMIPLVVPHLDESVTRWMDSHVRPHLNLPPYESSNSSSTHAPAKPNKAAAPSSKLPAALPHT